MQVVHGKCSHCLEVAAHTKQVRSRFARNVYRCEGCRQATVPCRRCSEGMAKVHRWWADELCSSHWDEQVHWKEGRLDCITRWYNLWDSKPGAFRRVLSALAPYRSDSIESFSIREVQKGSGQSVRVVYINGFLGQSDEEFLDWRGVGEASFPDVTAYGVRWESLRTGTTGEKAELLMKEIPIGLTTFGVSALWSWHHTAFKAEDTGKLLANILMRAKGQQFVLCGHSLGARVIAYALCELARHSRTDVVRTAHLLGGAVGADDTAMWKRAESVCSAGIANYYSATDDVLKYLYVPIMGFKSPPIGRNPINVPGIRNIDVSASVDGHAAYKGSFSKFVSYPMGVGAQ